jgi:ubiquinone/menaquinone biosynthesis C-methylase UbiE
MKNILFIHPEGNINNNPNFFGIVELLCKHGYKITIISPRRSDIDIEPPCEGVSIIQIEITNFLDAYYYPFFIPKELHKKPDSLRAFVMDNYGPFDLVIGIDRGIIEAFYVAQALGVPYGLISYEIFFSEETGKDFKEPEIAACRDISFAICQDKLRSFHLSEENVIPIEKIVDIPLAGRSVARGKHTHFLHELLRIEKDLKIALYIGEVFTNWAAFNEVMESSDSWNDQWVLILHQRYAQYDRAKLKSILAKKNKNVFISPCPSLPLQQIHLILDAADIGIAFYLPSTQSGLFTEGNNLRYLGMASGKISTYLQHGLPILINDIGEMSRYVDQYQLGAVVNKFEDIPDLLKNFTDKALSRCRENCYSFFENRLDLNITITPFLSLIHSLCGDSKYGSSFTTAQAWGVNQQSIGAEELQAECSSMPEVITCNQLNKYKHLQKYRTKQIAFGTENGSIFLGDGWGYNETLPDEQVTFNWAIGKSASLFLSLPQDIIKLTARMKSHHFPEPQIVTVKVDGKKIGEWQLFGTWMWEEHSVIIKPEDHRRDISIIEFIFSQNINPEHDDRHLAVLFESLSLDTDGFIITTNSFSDFTYSKQAHFAYFEDNDVELYGKKKDPGLCDLKVYQDLLVYTFLKKYIPKGSRILDIGGGDSRIIKAMKNDYECWNIDKLEGVGNGPNSIDVAGFRLIRDYIGNFNKELPDNYFDFVFSISALEHTPGDDKTNAVIIKDINRVMKADAFSLHCFDIVIKPEEVWTNNLLPYIFKHVKTMNYFIPFANMKEDPTLYVMTEASYDLYWKNTTQQSYKEFGKPLSYNVLWKKSGG